ncbi:MAG: DUF3147 family protein [Thermodesulfobacteriota bacterium]|jgi:hypothetical protein
MTDFFLLKLLLAFVVGSSIVTLSTVAAEKFGSKVGGFIGGLPSTVAITLFFIGFVQTPQLASEATNIIPLVVGFNGLFLVTYAVLARRGFAMGFVGALSVWFFLSFLAVILDVQSFWFSFSVFLILLIGSYSFLEKKLRLRSGGKVEVRITPSQIAFRALFSGSIVTAGVYLSKVGGIIWGGILSPFPAVFISTLVITWKSRGVEFSRMITKPLLISGMVNTVVFAAAARYFYLLSGLVLGTILAYAISGISAYGTYVFIKAKMT